MINDELKSQMQVRVGYALGFCFMNSNTDVVLIRKNKPEWQKGLLNGVGGKIERGETVHDAMVREFREETGVLVPEWEHFVTMAFQAATVFCFKVFVPSIVPVSTCTDELVYVKDVDKVLQSEHVIPNLKWLIPMALNDSQTSAPHWRGAPILKYL
jgi:8-oxo-dGTP diphosphatase